VPASTPVLLNLAMIGAAWLGAPWFASMGIEPIYAMAGGVMLGGALQLAVQIPRCGAWACCRASAWAGRRCARRGSIPARGRSRT